LIALGAEDGDVRAIEAAAAAARIPIKTVRDKHEGEAAQLGARLILVRPDHYVAWCGDRAPEDTRNMLARAVGAR
jgi:hypothetical protein